MHSVQGRKNVLRELRIRNFTVIDNLSMDFWPGMSILSGETGAGKSIIVDAIGLLLGERCSSDMVRAGTRDAMVEGVFDPLSVLPDVDFPVTAEDELILRRIISSQGKSRAYINDSSVSASTLSRIGRSLVDICGQHEHQDLIRTENHLRFLDELGGLVPAAGKVRELHGETIALRNDIRKRKEETRFREQRSEFLKFQIREIEEAGPEPGEIEELERERDILMNLSKLRSASESAYESLYGLEGSSIDLLSKAVAGMQEVSAIDPRAAETLSLLESALPLLQDASFHIRSLKDAYDVNPNRLQEVDERLEVLRKLRKKYGDTVGDILCFREKAASELRRLEDNDAAGVEMEAVLKAKEEELHLSAGNLSASRRLCAEQIEPLVVNELRELGFPDAAFRIDIRSREFVTVHGYDDAEFLFSANPGEPLKPLSKTASGGELSRIMLALKSVEIVMQSREYGNTAGPLKTLIFDEVDAGIGGVTAEFVGRKLKKISAAYQTVCITHLSQIAAVADHHYRVQKDMHEGRVRVRTEKISGKEREKEIARMLSGRVTDGALSHAQELLEVR